MTRGDITTAIGELIGSHLQVTELDPDAPLVDYGLDSARAAELIVDLEMSVPVEISDEEAAVMETLRDSRSEYPEAGAEVGCAVDCNVLFAAYSRPGLAGRCAPSVSMCNTAPQKAIPCSWIFPVGGNGSVLDLIGGLGASLFGHYHPAPVRATEDCLTHRLPFNAQASVRSESARLAARLSAPVGRSTELNTWSRSAAPVPTRRKRL